MNHQWFFEIPPCVRCAHFIGMTQMREDLAGIKGSVGLTSSTARRTLHTTLIILSVIPDSAFYRPKVHSARSGVESRDLPKIFNDLYPTEGINDELVFRK